MLVFVFLLLFLFGRLMYLVKVGIVEVYDVIGRY